MAVRPRLMLCLLLISVFISNFPVSPTDDLNGFCAPAGLEIQSASLIFFKEPAAALGFLSTDPRDIRFLLYPDPSKPALSEEIVSHDLHSLQSSGFNASKPVKILIHGFLSSGESYYPKNVKNAYLGVEKNSTYNVITVDWGKLANPGVVRPYLYPAVVENVEATGKRVGDFIVWLGNATGLDLKDVHLVGHSLGAHVSGWAGYTVHQRTGKKIGRITALDPAGPLFRTDIFFERIRNSDALFIDSYHTNALRLGSATNVGHVDFYVNGGTGQPGCGGVLDIGGICSHTRSHQIFAQTILEGPPIEHKKSLCACSALSYLIRPTYCCDKVLVVGEYCSERTKGEYFVNVEYTLGDENVFSKYGIDLKK